MAIEFNCPYCTALIRVPDSAGGGKGRCPKCATRIKVPKVSAAKEAALPPGDDGLLFASEPGGNEEATAFAESAPVEFASDESSAPAEFFVPAPRQLGELPVEPVRQPLRPGSVASKLKRKKSSGGWLIPVGFGVVLCGVFGWFLWQQYQLERLTGELTAESAATLQLPSAIIDRSQFRQSSEEVKEALAGLEKSPVRLPSSLMLIELKGASKGLAVSVNSGMKTQFYRVDLQDDPALMKYRADHAFELERMRSEQIDKSAAEFMIDYQRVIEKKADSNLLNDFRDGLALPALVRGLGYQVVAVYGNNYFPCVYEDRDGALYFLLPPGAQGFELTGRKHKDGTIVFPGSYRVKVRGEMKTPAKESKEDASDEEKKAPASMEPDETTEMKESKDGEAKAKKMDETK